MKSVQKTKATGKNSNDQQFECHFFIITQLHNNSLGLEPFVIHWMTRVALH